MPLAGTPEINQIPCLGRQETMSVPSKVLRCNKCNDAFNTVALNQNFRYLFKNTGVAMSRTLGFCADCDAPVAMESFDDIDQKLNQIELYSEWALERARRVLSINVTSDMKESSSFAVRGLQENAYALVIALQRKGDERCLKCLSPNVVKFKGDTNLDYDIAGCYEGSTGTGFHHPGCGGEYIVSGSDVRFMLSNEPQYFCISDSWEVSKREN